MKRPRNGPYEEAIHHAPQQCKILSNKFCGTELRRKILNQHVILLAPMKENIFPVLCGQGDGHIYRSISVPYFNHLLANLNSNSISFFSTSTNLFFFLELYGYILKNSVFYSFSLLSLSFSPLLSLSICLYFAPCLRIVSVVSQNKCTINSFYWKNYS